MLINCYSFVILFTYLMEEWVDKSVDDTLFFNWDEVDIGIDVLSSWLECSTITDVDDEALLANFFNNLWAARLPLDPNDELLLLGLQVVTIFVKLLLLSLVCDDSGSWCEWWWWWPVEVEEEQVWSLEWASVEEERKCPMALRFE